MATKQDMINKIVATFEYVEGIVERKRDTLLSGQTRRVCIAQVLVLRGGKMVEEAYPFVVFNEGQADEQAFWMSHGDPAPPAPEPTWVNNCQTWLRAMVSNGIILHFHSLAPDNVTKRATVTIVLGDAGTKTEQRYAVWQDAQAEWQYEKLVSA